MITESSYDIVSQMDWVRQLCSQIHAARKKLNIPTTQPLRSVTLYKGEELFGFLLSNYRDLISDECNVRNIDWEIAFDDDYRHFDITTEYSLNFKEAGRIFGRDTQEIGKLVRAGDVKLHSTHAEVGKFDVPLDLVTPSRKVDNTRNEKSLGVHVALVDDESFFVLDIQIYLDLYLQKLTQEVVKAINTERRVSGLNVGDFAQIEFTVSGDYIEAAGTYHDVIEKATKSVVAITPNIELGTQENEFKIVSISKATDDGLLQGSSIRF